MKPTFHLPDHNPRRDSVETIRRRPAQPRTDYHFRARSIDFSGCRQGEGYPSFRSISDSYFKKEARHHFASEAAFFAFIVVAVAVPVIEAVRGLAYWVL